MRRGLQRVENRARVRMREVDDHTELVRLSDDLAPEGAQPDLRVRRGLVVPDVVVEEVHELQQTHPAAVQLP